MFNTPLGSDNRNAPWNEKDFDRIGTCKICGTDIYEDDEFYEPDWGVYICDECNQEIDN